MWTSTISHRLIKRRIVLKAWTSEHQLMSALILYKSFLTDCRKRRVYLSSQVNGKWQFAICQRVSFKEKRRIDQQTRVFNCILSAIAIFLDFSYHAYIRVPLFAIWLELRCRTLQSIFGYLFKFKLSVKMTVVGTFATENIDWQWFHLQGVMW